jgi:hypothetical protein
MNQSELNVPTCIASKPCDTSVMIRLRVQILRKGSLMDSCGLSLTSVLECAEVGSSTSNDVSEGTAVYS